MLFIALPLLIYVLPVSKTWLQGIGLSYLSWLRSTIGESLGRLTTSQVCQMYIRPRTSRTHRSLCDELSLNVSTQQCVGEATWFISHTWSNSFADTVDSILLFFEGRDDAANIMLWFDVFVDSQFPKDQPSSQWYMGAFRESIERIGNMLLVIDAWDNPSPLKRAWLVRDISMLAQRHVHLHVCLSSTGVCLRYMPLQARRSEVTVIWQ